MLRPIGSFCVLLAFLLLQVEVQSSTAQEQAQDSGAVLFIENVGQFAEGARFQAWCGGQTLWLAQDGLWLSMVEGSKVEDRQMSEPKLQNPNLQPATLTAVNVKVSFMGANPQPVLEPFNQLETKVSYFNGNDPARWRADVPVWGGVRYKDLYPGIDLELAGEQGAPDMRLLVSSGADLGAVHLRVEGADAVNLEGNWLRLETSAGSLYLPLIRAPGGEIETPALLTGSSSPAVEVLSPFRLWNEPLPIPFHKPHQNSLVYSTYLGGSQADSPYSIAADAASATYVAGLTSSFDFPATTGAAQQQCVQTQTGDGSSEPYCDDLFVAKIHPSGTAFEYVTFLGGTSYDWAQGVAVDRHGSAFVTGVTYSADFPTTPNAYDSSYNENTDVFLTQIAPDGSALSFSTYIGGSSYEEGQGIALDRRGAIYLTGMTGSADFPSTPDSLAPALQGDQDGFVMKLDFSHPERSYSTYLGGSAHEDVLAIAVDRKGAAYVLGLTTSTDFPVTPSAYDTSLSSEWNDHFVAKLDPSGSKLAYATYLGGSFWESDRGGIAVDQQGSAYVTGSTASSDFPTTPGAYDRTCNVRGCYLEGYIDYNAYITKLNPSGSGLVYSTYLGGSTKSSFGYSIAIGKTGEAWLIGSTNAPDFPTTPDAFDRSVGPYGDAYLARLDRWGGQLLYSSLFGGETGGTAGTLIALDQTGAIHLGGYTLAEDFPVSPDALDPTYNGLGDAFVMKLWFKP